MFSLRLKEMRKGIPLPDLFNGFITIADAEVTAENISEAKGNLLKITTGFSEADALDVAKSIERKAHPVLRATEKFLYCSPEFADAYNDAYMLTHGGIVYNKKFEPGGRRGVEQQDDAGAAHLSRRFFEVLLGSEIEYALWI